MYNVVLFLVAGILSLLFCVISESIHNNKKSVIFLLVVLLFNVTVHIVNSTLLQYYFSFFYFMLTFIWAYDTNGCVPVTWFKIVENDLKPHTDWLRTTHTVGCWKRLALCTLVVQAIDEWMSAMEWMNESEWVHEWNRMEWIYVMYESVNQGMSGM